MPDYKELYEFILESFDIVQTVLQNTQYKCREASEASKDSEIDYKRLFLTCYAANVEMAQELMASRQYCCDLYLTDPEADQILLSNDNRFPLTKNISKEDFSNFRQILNQNEPSK